jgi:hypothetical protein
MIATAGDFAWPPWLESLSPERRVAAIIRAVAACHEAPRGPGHDDGKQHCTAGMAEHFLLKLLSEVRAGVPSLILKTDGDLTPEQVAKIREQFQAAYRDGRARRFLEFVPPDPAGPERIAELEQLAARAETEARAATGIIAAQAARITELEQLAQNILGRFSETGHPGYEARRTHWVNADTITRWETTIKGAAE